MSESYKKFHIFQSRSLLFAIFCSFRGGKDAGSRGEGEGEVVLRTGGERIDQIEGGKTDGKRRAGEKKQKLIVPQYLPDVLHLYRFVC